MEVTLPSKLVEFIASCDGGIFLFLEPDYRTLSLVYDGLCLELNLDNLSDDSFLHELKLEIISLTKFDEVCFLDLLDDKHALLKYLRANRVITDNLTKIEVIWP